MFDVTEAVAAEAVEKVDGAADAKGLAVARCHRRGAIDEDFAGVVAQAEGTLVEEAGAAGDSPLDRDDPVAIGAGIVDDLADGNGNYVAVAAARLAVSAGSGHREGEKNGKRKQKKRIFHRE